MAPNIAGFARLVVTLGWLTAGGWLAVLTVSELRYLWMTPPTPPEVTHDLVVKDATDQQGRHASFRILLFTDEFRWRLNSFDEIEHRGTPNFTEEMKEVLNSAEEIICVGASSEEIPSGVSYNLGRVQEERRAARRAEKIAVWVREVIRRPIPVRKLNVGHHTPTRDKADTSDQRRVVIILVLKHDEGANIDQSLRSAMAGESLRAPIFESLLTKYSLATGEAFTWVP
ncbi:MAG: hypothetical protein A3J29_20000 [Acidobacteria bacterium RIFCSPLOWO2_12_FULL_67_14b]|nr:MAG: hypothetical protein A3J29_20000 [Acidobacteria bacterium RIFCSPLOWO2_12_FULL_67_14b]